MQVTLEDTKRASVLLIRKLFLLMQNLDVLPNDVYLTMKLYYYDDGKAYDHKQVSFFWVMLKISPALFSKSPLLTTSHQVSRKENVTVYGLRARP